jgi:hypothetical protein
MNNTMFKEHLVTLLTQSNRMLRDEVPSPVSLVFEDEGRQQIVGIVLPDDPSMDFDLDVLQDRKFSDLSRLLVLSSAEPFVLESRLKKGRISYSS